MFLNQTAFAALAAALLFSLVAAGSTSSSDATATSVPAYSSTECPIQAVQPVPPVNRPHYSLQVAIGSRRRTVQGSLTVSFALEQKTDRLVFRLWPNAPVQARAGAKLTVANVRVNGMVQPISRPSATTLVVSNELAAGERVTASMRWSLRMPRVPTDRLAVGTRTIRLSSFFPLLAWDGSGWALDQPAPFLETWTSPTADFDVRIRVPRTLRVFATGVRVSSGHWRAVAVRDFALAAGTYAVARGTADAPAAVSVTAAVEPRAVAAKPFLAAAVRALQWLSARYGPYPWATFTVVVVADQTGPWGQEYPTMIFLSPESRFLTPHEAAHQWFYSLVGNNQARDPWLDETLAQWSLARYENVLAAHAGTAIPAPVRNRLGEPMSFWARFGFYPTTLTGLYEQGVKALAALGDADDVDCALRAYVGANAYRTVVPRDLLASLEPFFPDAENVLAGFGARFDR
jgi:hypothetical protein